MIASLGWDTLQKRAAHAQFLKPSHIDIAGCCSKHNPQSVPSAAVSPWKAASGATSSSLLSAVLDERMGALEVLTHGHFLIYLWQTQSLPPTPLSFSAAGDHYIKKFRWVFCLQMFHPECGLLVWTGFDFSLCEHARPRTKAAGGWLIVLIRSHSTALGGFQTELEEREESSAKQTGFRTRVWWAHHWRWTYGTSTQHSPWWGLVVHLAAIKYPTLPSSETLLVRGLSIFIIICLFLPFFFKYISTLLLGCSFQKAEELLGWNSYFEC